MNRLHRKRATGRLLAVAVFWALTGGLGGLIDGSLQVTPASADENPCNPCNPVAAVPTPGSTEGDDSHIPWDTAGDDNPCNPAAAVNPCNPCGGGQAAKVQLEFAADFRDPTRYRRVTGFFDSEAHGKRLVVTRVSPPESAKLYRQFAARVRKGGDGDYPPFPTGTIIVLESFQKDRQGRPASRGPLFAMKKEGPGYDASGNDWRYGLAKADMTMTGDGNAGRLAYCKTCHMSKRSQDFIFGIDR